jgi:lipid-binding SYLF domain-containing protein
MVPGMRTIMLGLILGSFVASTLAVEKTELDSRIRMLTAKLEAMQQKSDKRIPAENLRKARGIVLLDRTKAGFIFAYQGGGGVALVRNPKTDKWGPAAFLKANEASLGFQVGGEQTFFVILFMSTNAVRLLAEQNVVFGGEARGTAGDSSAGAEGNVSPTDQAVLVYDDREGLYGGAAIKGGAVTADDGANRVYYGQPLGLQEILFDNKVQPTDAVSGLAVKLDGYSKSSAHSEK